MEVLVVEEAVPAPTHVLSLLSLALALGPVLAPHVRVLGLQGHFLLVLVQGLGVVHDLRYLHVDVVVITVVVEGKTRTAVAVEEEEEEVGEDEVYHHNHREIVIGTGIIVDLVHHYLPPVVEVEVEVVTHHVVGPQVTPVVDTVA